MLYFLESHHFLLSYKVLRICSTQSVSHLFYQLCREYTYRYGKKHKTANLLDELYHKPHNIKRDFISEKKHKWANKHFDTYYKWGRLTTPPLAMKSNPECMFPDDPVKSYRKFYKTKQARFKMAWTNRAQPEWF